MFNSVSNTSNEGKDMPPRAAGSLGSSRSLARRITYEREQRGWKQTALARRMSDAGYEMTQSTISKIENEDPPRRITVDELVGFSTVFGIPADHLLLPPELVLDATARQLLHNWRRALFGETASRMEVVKHIARAPQLGQVLDELLNEEERQLFLQVTARWEAVQRGEHR
jgi:transcriptional regulator with XRE-family HTH domain